MFLEEPACSLEEPAMFLEESACSLEEPAMFLEEPALARWLNEGSTGSAFLAGLGVTDRCRLRRAPAALDI